MKITLSLPFLFVSRLVVVTLWYLSGTNSDVDASKTHVTAFPASLKATYLVQPRNSVLVSDDSCIHIPEVAWRFRNRDRLGQVAISRYIV